MIRINLLPDQFRRSERTSTKLFAAALGAVILVCSSFGWFGYVYFGVVGELQTERASAEERLAGMRERATYHDNLEKEVKEYEKRSATIHDIARGRLLWTEVLDQLLDVVNNDGNTERHMTWFKSIAVQKGDEKRGPIVTMPGYVQGSQMKKVADFHDDFASARFTADLETISPPQGKRELDTKRNPPEAYFFTMKWGFKPPKDWMRNQPSRAAARPVGK